MEKVGFFGRLDFKGFLFVHIIYKETRLHHEKRLEWVCKVLVRHPTVLQVVCNVGCLCEEAETGVSLA